MKEPKQFERCEPTTPSGITLDLIKVHNFKGFPRDKEVPHAIYIILVTELYKNAHLVAVKAKAVKKQLRPFSVKLSECGQVSAMNPLTEQPG
jgi:hypothetical protein